MKILVVDDHPVYREGLCSVLARSPGVEDVLQAEDGAQALELAAAHADLGLALVDLRMAGAGGIVVLEQLLRLLPALPVLMLSSSEDPVDVRRALASGARGYCPKSSSTATLLIALQVVLAGELYVPPFMALAAPAANPAPGERGGLTPRQREVLQSLGLGLSNKQIALRLGLEEKTVKGHISAIFKVLNVVHRMQAVEAARNAGLMDHPAR